MEILKNIPLPARTKYEFDNMAIGDCMQMPVKEGEDVNKIRHRALISAKSFAKRKGLSWKFSSSAIKGMARVWRIS